MNHFISLHDLRLIKLAHVAIAKIFFRYSRLLSALSSAYGKGVKKYSANQGTENG